MTRKDYWFVLCKRATVQHLTKGHVEDNTIDVPLHSAEAQIATTGTILSDSQNLHTAIIDHSVSVAFSSIKHQEELFTALVFAAGPKSFQLYPQHLASNTCPLIQQMTITIH